MGLEPTTLSLVAGLDPFSGEGHACRSDVNLREAMLPIARVLTREGDQQEMERQYHVVSGRMNEMPLADGLIAHIALKRPNGVEVINVWESLEQSQAAFERPEFQEALREAGMSPDDIQPQDVEVLNVRTR